MTAAAAASGSREWVPPPPAARWPTGAGEQLPAVASDGAPGLPPLPAEVDEALAQLEQIGAVAGALLGHRGLTDAERERGLLQLLAHAKRSAVPSLAAEAILRQLDASIDGTLHEPPRPLGDGWARRQRVLRAMGYRRCPTCAAEIGEEVTIRRLGTERGVDG